MSRSSELLFMPHDSADNSSSRAPRSVLRIPGAEQREIPVFHVPEAMGVDFDRTVGDVENAMARLHIAAKLYHIDTAEIDEAQVQAKEEDRSFEPLSIIRSKLDYAYFEAFKDYFINAPGGPPILYPDGVRFLDRLQLAGYPHFFLTKGVDEEWQRLKIMAAGYPVGADIIGHPFKARRLKDMRFQDGKFRLRRQLGGQGLFVADAIAVVDDKEDAMQDLAPDSHGYLLLRGGSPNQISGIPDNVDVITTLDELVVGQDGRSHRELISGPREGMVDYPPNFAIFTPMFPDGGVTPVVHRPAGY